MEDAAVSIYEQDRVGDTRGRNRQNDRLGSKIDKGAGIQRVIVVGHHVITNGRHPGRASEVVGRAHQRVLARLMVGKPQRIEVLDIGLRSRHRRFAAIFYGACVRIRERPRVSRAGSQSESDRCK